MLKEAIAFEPLEVQLQRRAIGPPSEKSPAGERSVMQSTSIAFPGDMHVETLAPRELYDRDELGVRTRLPLYGALVFAAGAFLITFDSVGSRSESMAFRVVSALIPSVVGGIAWALLFTWMYRRFGKIINDQWYFADPRMVPTAPSGYAYRLPCSWVASNVRPRAGMLYLGPQGLRFDPSVRLPRKLREPLVITPLNTVDVEIVDATLPAIARIWGRRTLPRIRVRWNANHADFALPGAREVAERLREKLLALQSRSPATVLNRSPA
jgi:hypothetical protein